MTTVRTVIKEKFNNFVKFLHEKLPEEKQAALAKYTMIPVELIIEYLKLNIIPLEHDFALLFMKLCNEHGIESTSFTPEEKEKAQKYFQFFSEIVKFIDE
jgi:hypothetical protein